MKRIILIITVLLVASSPLHSDSPFSLSVSGGADIPMAHQDIFNIGGGGSAAGTFGLGGLPGLRVLGQFSYFVVPVSDVDNTMPVLSFGVGGEYIIPLMPLMDLRAAAAGGYGLFFYPGSDPNGSPFAQAEVQLLFNLTSSLRLGVGGGYKHYFNGLYSGITAGLGTTISIGGKKGAQIEINNIEFKPVFPVLSKYYNSSPLGSLSLENMEKGPISSVSLTLFIEDYMSTPKECIKIESMEKGEIIEVPLYALFNDSVLDITEGTKVQAELTVEYDYLNDTLSKQVSETFELYDRNALTWDDDRKAAVFITAKDPNVLTFAKNFGGIARDRGTHAVDLAFSMAMGIYEALRLYGMNYVRDPGSAYDILSENSMAVDYLQFPYQTLQYKAGDCDDLSILFCSLLEAASVETAFVTVPGHIYMAFALKTDPGEIRKTFNEPDLIIYREDKAWLPVELTLLNSGFLKAWETGISQWKKYEDEAGFFPIHSAWETYEPVGFSSRSSDLDLPSTETFIAEFSDEMETFIYRQIQSRIDTLKGDIEQSNDPSRLYNRMGVLYARFGLYENAEEAFGKGADFGSHSARANLGNIYFLNEEYPKARDTFALNLQIKPNSAVSLLGLAKSEYEMRNFDAAEEAFSKMVLVKPQWAEEFAYLSNQTLTESRASDQLDKFTMRWDE
ncbi:MAG: hypothetical protein JEY99_15055 [Spirochaetales bacterium]|nr:hypothetical protein [Spirochaetales bacterium]